MALFSHTSSNRIVAELAAHQPELSAYVSALMPGDPSVPDVVQRACLTAWKKRSTFRSGTNFRAWLFSIARWEVRAYRKECGRRSWLVIDGELAKRISGTMVEADEATPTSDLRLALEACLRKLPGDQRELVTHRYQTDQPLRAYVCTENFEYGRTPGKAVGKQGNCGLFPGYQISIQPNCSIAVHCMPPCPKRLCKSSGEMLLTLL